MIIKYQLKILIDNPYHLIIIDREGEYLIKRKITCKDFKADAKCSETVPNFIKMWAFNIRALRIAANSRANLNATATILGILRYKADSQQYPDSLSELVVKGYIEAVPDDPYGDGKIVYKQTDNGFLLYSLGADFDDDSGTPSKWGEGDMGGDQVFWPVEGTSEYIELQSKVQQ